MKILETLNNEETSVTEKLTSVTALVETVRAKYGNTEVEIQAPKVPTTNGAVSIGLLTNDEKLVIATEEVKSAIAMASAVTENIEGAVFDRVFEGFVAVNPILVNLNQESDSEY